MLFTKYNINTALYPQSKKGKQFVRIRVTTQSSRIDLYTGISLTNSQWDRKNLMNYWPNTLIYCINATNRGAFLGELLGEWTIKIAITS